LNDGFTINNLQIVVDFENFDENIIKNIKTASSLKITGEVIESEGKGQDIEIIAKKITILGDNFSEEMEKTVLQPKKHSLEVLREQAHLRFRTNLFGAVFRVRSAVSFAIHQFFNQNHFFYMNTPIITGADAEGAGEMFGVTNFDLNQIPRDENGDIDFAQDFFGKKNQFDGFWSVRSRNCSNGIGKSLYFWPNFPC
jgi:asparaginyl-tRNA synthetase